MTNVAEQPSLSAVSLSPQPLPDGAGFASLCRGILLVEPDITLLNAEALLLTNSNYSVTPAFSQREIFALRETKAIALAILSDCFGARLLSAIAKTVRKQWPRARILILGRAGSFLEDHLYDEQIDHPSDPKQLLEDLERLYKDSWNQHSHTLDWDVKRSGTWATRSPMRESDPTKGSPLVVTVERSHRTRLLTSHTGRGET
jgi:DNA-binding response OmpR family regulator